MLTDIQKQILLDNSLADIPVMHIARVLVAVEEAENGYTETTKYEPCRVNKTLYKNE